MLKATTADLLFSKNDKHDIRLGDSVKLAPPLKNLDEVGATLQECQKTFTEVVCLMGYPDDEGISANQGRPGAKLAPAKIRRSLFRMTPPSFLKQATPPTIFDLGDLDLESQPLGDRHSVASDILRLAYNAGVRALTLGGGHDYGFPDARAYCEWAKEKGEKPLVINFDAHLDVRPDRDGITSGTPFYRLLSMFPDIDFVELGLQSQCNSAHHLAWARSKGAHCNFEEERLLAKESLTTQLSHSLGEGVLRRRSAFLSVDIDGFSSAVAPGASQSWPTGFMPDEFFATLSFCLSRFDIRGLGIYEVSPPLDIDDRTSRLAALIAHRFVFQL